MLAHGVEPGRAGFQAWPGRRLRLRLRLRLCVRVSVCVSVWRVGAGERVRGSSSIPAGVGRGLRRGACDAWEGESPPHPGRVARVWCVCGGGRRGRDGAQASVARVGGAPRAESQPLGQDLYHTPRPSEEVPYVLAPSG